MADEEIKKFVSEKKKKPLPQTEVINGCSVEYYVCVCVCVFVCVCVC